MSRLPIEFLLMCPALICGALFGQTTFATITGRVTDATGALVPGAAIAATNMETNIVTRTTSNEAGIYTLPQLKEGRYDVRLSAAGFKEFVAQGILLEARDYRRLDVRLEVGGVAEAIEVTASTALVETETARLSDTRTAEQLVKLPLNSRSIGQFRALVPGAVQGTGSSVTVFGSRSSQGWTAVDGTTNGGDGDLAQNLEWMQEFKTDAATAPAEFGALVTNTFITKSGANQVHGSFYQKYRSPFMNARNPFAAQRGGSVSREFGGSVSGPIWLPKVYNGKNRTFFFLSSDTNRAGRPTAQLTATVPLEAWRQGNFGVPIRNPFTAEVYQDGRIPGSVINPVSRKIQDRFYPLPNYGNPGVLGSGNFRDTFRFGTFHPTTTWIGRLDHRLSGRDYVFARFNHSFNPYMYNQWDGRLPAFGNMYQDRRALHLGATYGHTFSPNLVNEARIGHRFGNMPAGGPLSGLEVTRYLGIQGLAPGLPDISGVFGVSFSGLGLQGLSQQSWTSPGYMNKIDQYSDQISYFRGRHSLKAGVSLLHYMFQDQTAGAGLFGSVIFANTYTKVPGIANSGNAYADFLFGVPTTARRDFPPQLQDLSRWAYDFFVQDDWKVTPRLTLNVGLRYEYHPNDAAAGGKLALFDTSRGVVVVADRGLASVSPLMPKSYVDVVKASSVGLPADTLLHTDINNFAPRVGFAYRPFQSGHTVLRGGFGVYYDQSVARKTSGANAPPFTIAEPAFTNTQPAPTVVLPQAYPSSGTGGPSTVSLPGAINTNLRTPYSQQWTLTAEHERWDMVFRASYVGMQGRQMLYSRNINAPAPDDRLFVDKPRPFPKYPAIMYTDNGANHSYNGLALTAERRMKNGLFLQVNHTWARDIGDADTTLENPFDRRRERGPQQQVPTHRLTLLSIYDLPVGHGRKWFSQAPRLFDLIAGGWELNAIAYFQTGRFLTPTVSIPDPNGIAFTTSRNRPLVNIRPDRIGDASVANPNINGWFNPAAFAAPPIGRWGNSGPGVIIGPGENVWHGGLAKEFRLADRPRSPRLRVAMTATNVFNHPNWGNPSLNLSAVATVATIRSIGGPNNHSNVGDKAGNRSMQLEARLEW